MDYVRILSLFFYPYVFQFNTHFSTAEWIWLAEREAQIRI